MKFAEHIGATEERIGRDHFLGEVGFRYDDFADTEERVLLGRMLSRRWPSMHTELLPFAHDGAGNRFCFILPHDEATGSRQLIGYWMYETYQVVPIASSFSHFLQWVAMRAMEKVERGVDPHIDAEHVERDVLPLLETLEIPMDLRGSMRTIRTPLAASHEGMLELDPGSPATLLTEASRELRRDRKPRAREYAQRAVQNFHRFAAAHDFLAKLESDARREDDSFHHMLETLTSPLCYAGDALMPGFHDVPEIEHQRVVQRVLASSDAFDLKRHQPFQHIFEFDNPEDPFAWMRCALEFADQGDLREAVDVAANAHFLARSTLPIPELADLLHELYMINGAALHAKIVDVDRESSVRATAR